MYCFRASRICLTCLARCYVKHKLSPLTQSTCDQRNAVYQGFPSGYTPWPTLGLPTPCHTCASHSQEPDICETFKVGSLADALQREDAVQQLHRALRDCVDMMGVGGAKQARTDTMAEDSGTVQRASSDGKDLGDVKCVYGAGSQG